MRKSETQGLADLIKAMKKAYGLENKLSQASIANNWEKIVGKSVANYTEKLYFKDRVLFIHLSHPILRHELSGQREKLRQRLNEEFRGDFIQEIILK